MEQQVSLNGEQTEDQHVHSGAQSSLNVSGSGARQQVLHSRCLHEWTETDGFTRLRALN